MTIKNKAWKEGLTHLTDCFCETTQEKCIELDELIKAEARERNAVSCRCGDDVVVGEYTNQICISNLPIKMSDYKKKQGGNPESICLDLCITKEIIQLWSLGITTTEYYCGHHKQSPYIRVVPEDENRMIELGYTYENRTNGSFNPLSIINPSKK